MVLLKKYMLEPLLLTLLLIDLLLMTISADAACVKFKAHNTFAGQPCACAVMVKLVPSGYWKTSSIVSSNPI